MKINKKILLTSIISVVLSSIISVAAVKLSAKEIGFTSSNEGWNVDNVEDAINDLYELELERPKIIKDYVHKVSYTIETRANAKMIATFDCSNVKEIRLSGLSIQSGTLTVYGILEDGSSENIYSISKGDDQNQKIDFLQLTNYKPTNHKEVKLEYVSPLGYNNMEFYTYVERIY